MTPSHETSFVKPQARLLHAVCACNYFRQPPGGFTNRVFSKSRFIPSRHILYDLL